VAGIPRKPEFEHETIGAAARVKPRPMRTLLVMIGAWFVLNVFLVVAASNDELRS
jgi:hypothetical protein